MHSFVLFCFRVFCSECDHFMQYLVIFLKSRLSLEKLTLQQDECNPVIMCNYHLQCSTVYWDFFSFFLKFISVEHAISWQGKEVQLSSLWSSSGVPPPSPQFTPDDTTSPRVFILRFQTFPPFQKRAQSLLSIKILDQTRRGRGAITFPDYLYLIHNAS